MFTSANKITIMKLEVIYFKIVRASRGEKYHVFAQGAKCWRRSANDISNGFCNGFCTRKRQCKRLYRQATQDMNRALLPDFDEYGDIIPAEYLSLSMQEVLLNENNNIFNNPLAEVTVDSLSETFSSDHAAGDLGKGMYFQSIVPQFGLISGETKDTVFGIENRFMPAKELDIKYGQYTPVFRVDRGHKYFNYPHTHSSPYIYKDTPWLKQRAASVNHKPISQNTFNYFANHGNSTVKGLKNVGKAMTAVGIVLDAYELGSTGYRDYQEDGELGKETIKVGVGISASYAGGYAGTKLGVMGGAAIGTLILPGIGTVVGAAVGGVVGGIGGAIGARQLGEYAVEELYTGD